MAHASTAPSDDKAPTVDWKTCYAFPDATVEWMVGTEQVAEFKALWSRTQCGTLSVPLDYSRPDGTRVTIAVTRLKATDQAHRLGSIAVNPGAGGYLTPLYLVLAHGNGTGEALNGKYDLIGFDPRGVGYSTKVDCPDPDPLPAMGPGRTTEDQARAVYAAVSADNTACAEKDPAFLGQLTTANVARDLDRIRAGVGEQKWSYLGTSWGSELGAMYRGMFPDAVTRMWLDSPAPPYVDSGRYASARAAATALDVDRFAGWLASRNATYGFGTTADAVRTALALVRGDYQAHPRTFTDLPGVTIGSSVIAQVAGGFSLSWGSAAPLLAALRDTRGGGPAPALVRSAFGPADSDPGSDESGPSDDGSDNPPADLPEDANSTMTVALLCNEDSGARDFDTRWAAYNKQVTDYPVTGESTYPVQPCAGWTLPVQPVTIKRGNGSLMMSAHRYESVSPYSWAQETQAAIGGSVLSVGDDITGSVFGRASDCPAKVVAYFTTGQAQNGDCAGVPIPPDGP